jgi:hypothetical protein
MKLIAVFIVACAVAVASGAVHKYIKTPTKFVDETFLVKQKAILDLLQHVHQKDIYTEGKWLTDKEFFSYDYDYKTKFTNVEVVTEFLNFYRTGMLPRGEVFSIMNETHRRQVIALFHLFYYAKDWESFYQVATFARLHVNEGMFIYALTVAVLHRKDTTGVVLPPPYEVYPFYFFNYDVVRKAQQYKMQGFDKTTKTEKTYTVVIPSNYTDYLYEANIESKLSYFMEDIGLNTYYYYFHMDYPFWMTGKNYLTTDDRRGELYLFKHQQILARYYLERLSHGMGNIPTFSWTDFVRTGYYPALRYYNGEYFPSRDNYYNLYNEFNYYDVDIVTRYERRIRDAIDLGYFTLYDGTKYELTKPEDIDYLGQLIKGFTDVEDSRFFGYLEYFAKMLLGTSMTTMKNYRTIPSVLEHFETSMRDPIFYQLYKRIINYYWSFKNHLPSYTSDDLLFEGVKIESVVVDKLVTFFDTYYSDITNVVDVEQYDDTYTKTDMYTFGRKAYYTGKDFVIKAKQLRLNHKPFNVRLNVLSDKAQRAVVKVFLGPKYNEFGFEYKNINENRENFVELEHFVVDLVAGTNTIDRSCQQFSKFIGDHTSYFDLYKDVMMSTKSEMKFAYDKYEKHCGFPWRLMLPKGTKGGMEFQMFFIIVPQIDVQTTMMRDESMFVCGNYDQYFDYRSYGFPLDRKIREMYWYTPNMYYYDTIIYHEDTIDMKMF